MIIIDSVLAKRASEGNPIRVGMVGAGYMAAGIGRQLLRSAEGMRLVAVSNRTLSKAKNVYVAAGCDEPDVVDSLGALEKAVEDDRFVVTEDAALLCSAGNIDVIVETTGDVECGARVAFDAIKHGKHVILMNAEVDASIGPILKSYADRAGVVYSYTDGDEPGVAMNLYRTVDSMGYKPVLMGQIKGFLNHYRNPQTQQEFAEKHKQKAAMVASFADGSKLALESAIMGNATGFQPAVRGMHGYECGHVKDLLTKFEPGDFENGGFVDFVLGAEPHTGAFVMTYNDDPVMMEYMKYFKFGDGPLYMFYIPFHLPHLQLPHSIARAALFNDPTLTPMGAPVCDTMAIAKRDLKAGELLDGMGGFTCYGLVDSYENCRQHDFLPMALSVDCRLKCDVPKDRPITYKDVDLPVGRLCDKLREEQTRHFQEEVLARA